MKKSIRIVIDSMIVRASVDCFIALAYYHTQLSFMPYIGRWAKIFCYILCAFCYAATFKMISQKIKTMWLKWSFALAPATLFTTQILFVNPFLQFLNINYMGDRQIFEELIPYEDVLRRDIAYKMGEHRYLLYFAAMYALCALVIFFNSEVWVRIRRKIDDAIDSCFDFAFPGDLELLIDLYQRGIIKGEVLDTYYQSMGCTDYEKREFKKCLEKYPCRVLFDLFLMKFEDSLSEKEHEHYTRLSEECDCISIEEAGQ